MTRAIHYLPKITQARTEYRELRPEDRDWLLLELSRWLVKMGTLSNTNDSDLKTVRDQYWRRRRAGLPRGRDGQNSPESLVAGMLENMLYTDQPQRDFSDRQCTAIEDISRWMGAIDDTFTEITFMIGLFE